MARVLGYGGLANTNGARSFSGKAAAGGDPGPNPTDPEDVVGGGWFGPFAFLFGTLLGRGLWFGLVLMLVGCSADLVAPEDERCTIYVDHGESYEISRWQIKHCERVRVVVVTFGGDSG